MSDPENPFGSAQYYHRLLRHRHLTRAQVYKYMQERLEKYCGFTRTTFSKQWPEKTQLRPDTLVLHNREYREFGEYTDKWFAFQDNVVYSQTRSSDPIWDAYTYHHDRNEPDTPVHLPFNKALIEIFDKIQLERPETPASTTPE